MPSDKPAARFFFLIVSSATVEKTDGRFPYRYSRQPTDTPSPYPPCFLPAGGGNSEAANRYFTATVFDLKLRPGPWPAFPSISLNLTSLDACRHRLIRA